MGLIGGVLRATGNNDPNVISRVKNPAIGALNTQAVGDYNSVRQGGQDALGDFITKYLGNTAAAESNAGQESGAIGQFYNGQMATRLGALRAQRQQAVNDAANLGAQQAMANVNRSRLGGGGTGGSYEDRLMMGAVQPYKVQAAVDNANQARSDLDYVTKGQIGLTGQRTALADTLAARGLVPQQQRENLYRAGLQDIGTLTNNDQANTFYGLKRPTNMWADIADSADAGIMNAAATYSAVGGGGGMSRGGEVAGPGSEHSDSIPIRVSRGEFVIPASAVKIPGVLPLLKRIRAAGLALENVANEHPEHFRRGGRVWGYDMGGEIGVYGQPADYEAAAYGGGGYYGTESTVPYTGGGGGGGQKSGGGGGGGGLAGSAQQLNARATADLYPDWQKATFVPMSNQAQPGGGLPNMPEYKPPQAPSLGNAGGSYRDTFASTFGDHAVPDNFETLKPNDQQAYMAAYARAQAERDAWSAAGKPNPYE